jgi:hypothetical protein
LRTLSEARPELAADVDYAGSVPVRGFEPARPQDLAATAVADAVPAAGSRPDDGVIRAC